MGRMFSVGCLAYVSPGCRRINAKPSNRMQCSAFSPGILATTSVALTHAGRSLSISPVFRGSVFSFRQLGFSAIKRVGLRWFVSNSQSHHRRVAVPALAMVAYLLRKPRPTPLFGQPRLQPQPEPVPSTAMPRPSNTNFSPTFGLTGPGAPAKVKHPLLNFGHPYGWPPFTLVPSTWH